jgi:hypothetical protein
MMTSVLRLRAILLFSALVCFTATSYAQTKTFELVDSKLIEVMGYTEDDNKPFETWANFKNLSSNAIDIAVDYDTSTITPGHKLTVCWGSLCFPNHTTPFPANSIAAGQSTSKNNLSHFDVKLTADRIVGESRVTYRFRDLTNNTSQNFEFIFGVRPSGIFSYTRMANGAHLSSPYPSPSSHTATFNYALPAHIQNPTLKVYDMMGRVVQIKELTYSADEVVLNVQHFQNGIYFYSLSHEGQVLATKKLIVTH